jgi:hypothetical protein
MRAHTSALHVLQPVRFALQPTLPHCESTHAVAQPLGLHNAGEAHIERSNPVPWALHLEKFTPLHSPAALGSQTCAVSHRPFCGLQVCPLAHVVALS